MDEQNELREWAREHAEHQPPRLAAVALLVLLALGVVACGANSDGISGRVVDKRGTPMANVLVAITGTALSARTAADGTFEVDYVPGSFVVRFSSPEMMPLERPLSVAQHVAMPLGAVEVVRLPAQRIGLMVAQSAGYVEVPAVEIATAEVHPCPLSRTWGWSTGGWQSWRPVHRGAVPVLYGPALQAFVQAVPSANWKLIALSPDGVLGANFVRSVAVGDACANPNTGIDRSGDLTWTPTEDHERWSLAIERLAAGQYCLVQGTSDAALHLTARPEQARCFEWRSEASPAARRP